MGPSVRRHENLGRGLILEVSGKFVDALLTLDFFVVGVRDNRLILDSHAFDGLRDTLGSCLFTMLSSDLLLLQLIDLCNSSVLHLEGECDFLPFLLVLDHVRLNFDFLLFVVLLCHCLDALVQLFHCLLFTPILRGQVRLLLPGCPFVGGRCRQFWFILSRLDITIAINGVLFAHLNGEAAVGITTTHIFLI